MIGVRMRSFPRAGCHYVQSILCNDTRIRIAWDHGMAELPEWRDCDRRIFLLLYRRDIFRQILSHRVAEHHQTWDGADYLDCDNHIRPQYIEPIWISPSLFEKNFWTLVRFNVDLQIPQGQDRPDLVKRVYFEDFIADAKTTMHKIGLKLNRRCPLPVPQPVPFQYPHKIVNYLQLLDRFRFLCRQALDVPDSVDRTYIPIFQKNK